MNKIGYLPDCEARAAILQALGAIMSDLSEDAYCAGWLSNWETMLPPICREAVETGLSQSVGMARITPELACTLITLSQMIGGWPTFNMDGPEPPYVLVIGGDYAGDDAETE